MSQPIACAPIEAAIRSVRPCPKPISRKERPPRSNPQKSSAKSLFASSTPAAVNARSEKAFQFLPKLNCFARLVFNRVEAELVFHLAVTGRASLVQPRSERVRFAFAGGPFDSAGNVREHTLSIRRSRRIEMSAHEVILVLLASGILYIVLALRERRWVG